MVTYAEAGEMLVNAMRAKAMAESAISRKDKQMLARIAAYYEMLAYCNLIILDAQRYLDVFRRLLGEDVLPD